MTLVVIQQEGTHFYAEISMLGTGTDLEFVTNDTDSIYYTYDNQYIADGISCIRNNMDKVR